MIERTAGGRWWPRGAGPVAARAGAVGTCRSRSVIWSGGGGGAGVAAGRSKIAPESSSRRRGSSARTRRRLAGASAVRRRADAGTLLLWLAFFMSLLVVYLLSNWLQRSSSEAPVSLSRASLVTAMFQIGGTSAPWRSAG